MSKTLFLLRHARAAEKQGSENDEDRYLDSIGLQNSTRMGINFSNKKVKFDIIITSPAERARQTASLIAEQIKYDPSKIHVNPEIYEASVRTLLRVVNQLKDEWKNVLIVGHNPSVSYLAEFLSHEEIGNMATCSVAKIEFEFDKWEMISEGNGKLISYEHPELLNF